MIPAGREAATVYERAAGKIREKTLKLKKSIIKHNMEHWEGFYG